MCLYRTLIIHLQRYTFNVEASRYNKNVRRVVIPRFLSLRSACDETTLPPCSLPAPHKWVMLHLSLSSSYSGGRWDRVATNLENMEKSGNLKLVSGKSGNLKVIREKSGKMCCCWWCAATSCECDRHKINMDYRITTSVADNANQQFARCLCTSPECLQDKVWTVCLIHSFIHFIQ